MNTYRINECMSENIQRLSNELLEVTKILPGHILISTSQDVNGMVFDFKDFQDSFTPFKFKPEQQQLRWKYENGNGNES